MTFKEINTFYDKAIEPSHSKHRLIRLLDALAERWYDEEFQISRSIIFFCSINGYAWLYAPLVLLEREAIGFILIVGLAVVLTLILLSHIYRWVRHWHFKKHHLGGPYGYGMLDDSPDPLEFADSIGNPLVKY